MVCAQEGVTEPEERPKTFAQLTRGTALCECTNADVEGKLRGRRKFRLRHLSRYRNPCYRLDLFAGVGGRNMLAEVTEFEPSRAFPRELLRESHHRITNHLALLVAMIRTQNAAIKKGPETLTREVASGVLNEISANVVAMAHLHRQFVRDPGSATVDLGDLLIESCSQMMASLALKDRVRFRHTLKSVCEITADEASSISLLLSEVVMNAIKYACSDGSLLEIDVSSRVTADGHP